jgi:tripartite ATP-independent transporter DctP family solute receptor
MVKMKKSFVCLIALCVLLSLFASAGSAAPRSLRLSHSALEGHHTYICSEIFKKEVEARTNGAVTIEIFPASMLGNLTDVVEQIRLGVVDCGVYTSGQLSNYDTAFSVVSFPFFFDGQEHVYACYNGKPGQMLKDKALEYGFKVINHWDNGFRQFTNSVRPLNAPADFVGLRLRVPPEIAMEASVRALGATPTTIAYPELYMAMLQGVCDGQENPLATIFNDKFYEAQKYVAKADYMYIVNNLMFNAAIWNSFTPEIQNAIMEAGKIATERNLEIAIEKENWFVEQLKEHGMEFTYPDTVVFREALKPATQELLKLVDNAWYEEFAAAVDEVRQSLK